VQNPERNAQGTLSPGIQQFRCLLACYRHYSPFLSFFSTEAVFGAVLATQSGREIDLVNSFELLHTRDENNKVIIDKEYLTMKQEQCRAITTFFVKHLLSLSSLMISFSLLP
jgi:hypothetical protein